jgi:hypothetical protein
MPLKPLTQNDVMAGIARHGNGVVTGVLFL